MRIFWIFIQYSKILKGKKKKREAVEEKKFFAGVSRMVRIKNFIPWRK